MPADATAPADAAIVIVNYRTPAHVERCLQSVRATAHELHLETVVVDNASRDGSVERLRAALPGASVLAMEENGGFAAGVNAGFRHTRAEYVVLLNPDTELRPGALQALLEHLRTHPRVGVVAPLLEDHAGHITPNGYRHFPNLFTVALDLCVPVGYAYALVGRPELHPYALPPAALRAGRAPAWACGAALAIRRAAYADAGPFDEGFFLYFEEAEWQQRVVARGWAIALAPQARVCHLVRGGGEDALAHSPHYLASALRYLRMRRVPRPLARAALAASLTITCATLYAIAALPAKRARALGQARAYRVLLRAALTRAEAARG